MTRNNARRVLIRRRRPDNSVLNEFGLIKKYFTHRPRHTLLGVGDDAALIRVRPGHVLAISADMLVEGRHFFKGADPEALGHKTLAVNLSDLAAMGATPRWATLALALPKIDTQWLAAFTRGFMRLARAHDVDLIGGDTTRGPLNLCVQIMGEVPANKALRRDGARVGDDVWVSGTLGDAALAVAARKKEIRLPPRALIAVSRRLDQPTPRVALGKALRGVARSAIDISDGLLGDLAHICERSRVAAVIELEVLPLSALMRAHVHLPLARRAMLSGGDDYELCFTALPSRRAAVLRAGAHAGVPVTRIGRMIRAPAGVTGVAVIDGAGLPLPIARRGFDHFG
ncbi:MAG TPA: thiamine-phosphate kinase [Burkholderiales bacterium]|nr:thiamine-phosphate kinase [Burkholderiales bacterium]